MVDLSPYQSRRWEWVGARRPCGVVRQCADGWERAGALRQVYDHFGAGHRRVCLVMPTGSGKTVVACELIRDVVARGWRVIFVVDRMALVGQSSRTFERIGVPVGWVWRGENEDAAAPVQVVCVQSLESGHGAEVAAWVGQEKTLIIIDEAHETALRASVVPWLQGTESRSRFLLLTATPDSMGREIELGDVCDALAVGPTYRELIDVPDERVTSDYEAAGFPGAMGALCPTTYLPLEPRISVSGVRVMPNGEYDAAQLSVPAMEDEIIEAVVDAWLEHAGGRRTVGFCVTRGHALKQAEAFARRGISAAIVTGVDKETGFVTADGFRKAKRSEVDAALDELRVSVLMSVDALSKGWDLPSVEVALDLCHLRKKGKWIQKVGRIKRVCARTGKRMSWLLDFAGNHLEHGQPEWIDGWTLPRGEVKRKVTKANVEATGRECPSCGAVVSAALDRCPKCGDALKPSPMLEEFDGFKIVVPDGYLAPIGSRVRNVESEIRYVGDVKIVEDEWGIRETQWIVGARIGDGCAWCATVKSGAVEKGQRIKVSGTVKDHRTGKYTTTVLNRVKFGG